MNTLTLSLVQLEVIVATAFFAGVGASTVCHAIIRAALFGSLTEPEPEVIVVEAPERRPPALPARQRFAPPLPAISPVQWARRSFDDPRQVRMSILIGATS